MSLEELYKISIRSGDEFPYRSKETAISRLRWIYRTSRRGNIETRILEKIWERVLCDVLANLSNIPDEYHDYNTFAKKNIKKISTLISKGKKVKFGIGQKIFNLFMKDLWAWYKLNSKIKYNLHFPLDRRILNKLNKLPNKKKWKAWSKIDINQNHYESTWKEYIQIQNSFREYFKSLTNFKYPIELEQIIWNNITLIKT